MLLAVVDVYTLYFMLFPQDDMFTVKNGPPAPATVSHQAEVALAATAAASCLITSGVFYTRKIFQIKSEFAEQILLHFIFCCPTNFKLPGPSQAQELHNKIFVPSPVSLSWSWTQNTGHQEPSLKSVHALSLSHGTIKQVSLGTRPVRPLGAWLLGIRL